MTDVAAWPSPASAMTPVPHRVRSRVVENFESATIWLEPVGHRLASPRPGQFTMLYAFGVGEIPMSVSGVNGDGAIGHTIRLVGAVSRALHDVEPGTVVGVRGPFGTDWDLGSCTGRDLVIVAGGCGLAPLRPVILATLADRTSFGRVMLVAGARTPRHLLFYDEAAGWAQAPDLEAVLTVDSAGPDWRWRVGLVTEPLRRLTLEPARTTALICGPESMMRFSAQALLAKGMAAADIRVSLERNMQCGIGWCGHCQLGPLLLCRDGPVVGYDVAEPLLRVKEL
ncbi:FAD/NAD(P)-binding protein [Mycobacterium shimoidei]|uniref:Hydrogenase/ sulfur reductase [Rhodococcus jostii RHA1] n=1 Tax=Mycobacterium shimoidei TaxID=29313 RepID=A0A1E3THU3_MYCSH|nr:FAD/NAD(P)-binding protein [Mycobacterium shimoidei]MCV7257524.1 FAD/NAD(P)-binding protein [Mycobacterium shimoidei]ODR13996.1 oxidoreductase [Mycobacterium shimoidei]ORW82535.1 oxidoreductase [Mycobacterium shimoidei]SRX94144.1 hydrogenase/ sulfur reductase [Rhodococcus jostii RHA1] [Mycobacterium shimoidei]